MHWTAAQPGCLDAERELILVEQTPGEIVFLSAADSDLAAVANAWRERFGVRLRVAHAAPLRQPVAADHYIEKVVRYARLVIARLLGGAAYFPHLVQALSDLKDEPSRPRLLLLSGTDRQEEELTALGDFSPAVCARVFEFFKHGGAENLTRAGEAIERLLRGGEDLPEAVPVPAFGIYRRSASRGTQRAWLCFYRAWHQTSDLAVVDAVCAALEERGFSVVCFYAFSLREPEAQRELLRLAGESAPDVILTMQSFAVCLNSSERLSFFEQLGCPVLQVSAGSSSREAWLKNPAGISPAEVAMNVALPEIDGRVFSSVAGFKENDRPIAESEFTAKRLQPDDAQVAFVADLAANWARLRQIGNAEKRIAVILSNYPNRNGRIGNGVGLDTPASVVKLLTALRAHGCRVEPLPESGEQLMAWLQDGVTNDPEQSYGRCADAALDRGRLLDFIARLPERRREELRRHWPSELDEHIAVPGKWLGNIFVGIQPPRGFSLQTQAIYHSPDLPPPPQYLAFYLWIREQFGAHAVVHFGKHGNLEWLPGRSIALGPDDYPQLCLGPTPNIYPFIVNNPGEGAQAKRRISAVIVDHLTPPLAPAGLYDDLEKMERLLEEHAHASTLYPARAAELEEEIQKLLATVSWRDELPAQTIEALGGYLCEIKESQIRSGLHILGEPPRGEREIEFLVSLLRASAPEFGGLGDHIAQMEWVRSACDEAEAAGESQELARLRKLVRQQLRPRLALCRSEIDNVLAALDGRFVSPGPAGAPTRGRLDVLPTGRNFFTIDPRTIPTQTAWRCGQRLGDLLLERHRQEHGEFPRHIALVIWGTSNMRTGGDDIAQAMWLWGCEPVWEDASGRVVDFRILPLGLLGRPRVDVLLRVSGLFRDAFGDTMRLLATIPKRLAELDEPPEMNAVRAAFLRESERLANGGVNEQEASRLACLRVFSSGPGCYGTGLLTLIDAGNWESPRDLAEVFCQWGSHAYGADGAAGEQPELLRARLAEVEVVHQNQDNREHDILDSDDYFQFQGGLRATVEALRGSAPATYHGDSSRPDQPKVRTLREELVRVIRSRVLNPRWIEAMRRHGYKGAFEMAATVDYLFGYSATTRLVEDHHFEEAARSLLLDPEQRAFFQRHNPAALLEAAERLLEAGARGLWRSPQPATITELEELLLDTQGRLE